jgi:hypothetical protein
MLIAGMSTVSSVTNDAFFSLIDESLSDMIPWCTFNSFATSVILFDISFRRIECLKSMVFLDSYRKFAAWSVVIDIRASMAASSLVVVVGLRTIDGILVGNSSKTNRYL